MLRREAGEEHDTRLLVSFLSRGLSGFSPKASSPSGGTGNVNEPLNTWRHPLAQCGTTYTLSPDLRAKDKAQRSSAIEPFS